MKIITTLTAVAGLAALSACGGGDRAEENMGETLEANTLVVDNVTTDMTMDMNAMGDMNMDMNADMNMPADANMTGETTTNAY